MLARQSRGPSVTGVVTLDKIEQMFDDSSGHGTACTTPSGALSPPSRPAGAARPSGWATVARPAAARARDSGRPWRPRPGGASGLPPGSTAGQARTRRRRCPLHRLPGPGCHPRPIRAARGGQRRRARRAVERQDHAGAALRRGGAGERGHRGLAGPRRAASIRWRRSAAAWTCAGCWSSARQTSRRASPWPAPCCPAAAWACSSWTCRLAHGPARTQLASPGGPCSPGRRAPHRAGAGLGRRDVAGRAVGRQRAALRAGAACLAAPGPGRGRPAHHGGRGQEPLRAAGSERGPGHPLPLRRANVPWPRIGWPAEDAGRWQRGCAPAGHAVERRLAPQLVVV